MKKLLIILLAFTLLTSGLIFSGESVFRKGKPLMIKSKLQIQLKEIGKSINRNKKLDPGTLTSWKNLIKELQSSKTPYDINNLVQSVLSESKKEMQKDLEYFSSKVKYFNKLKQDIRKQIKELRDHRRQFQNRPGSKKKRQAGIRLRVKIFSTAMKFSKRVMKSKILPKPDRSKLLSGKVNVSYEMIDFKTKNDFEKYIKELEEDLSKAGDDGQLANLDLQNTLEKQQQMIQMMSNAQKVLTDVAMAVIRKLG